MKNRCRKIKVCQIQEMGKRGLKGLLSIMLFISVLSMAGCSAEKHGGEINRELQTIKVKDVMLNPSLQGQTVNLEGIITSQCMSNGCWFFLNDGTGQIYINLAPKAFAIPPRTGKMAKVTGVVQQGQDGFQVVATGVEIK